MSKRIVIGNLGLLTHSLIDQFNVCKHSGCTRNVAAENRERIAFKTAKGPHGSYKQLDLKDQSVRGGQP